jgi:hypothetical protein
MQLFIKTFSGKHITLDIAPSDHIWYVKERIQAKEGVQPDDMRLIFCGMQMEDELLVEDYSVNPDSTFHMVGYLRG